jgi:hypothetical protein
MHNGITKGDYYMHGGMRTLGHGGSVKCGTEAGRGGETKSGTVSIFTGDFCVGFYNTSCIQSCKRSDGHPSISDISNSKQHASLLGDLFDAIIELRGIISKHRAAILSPAGDLATCISYNAILNDPVNISV